MKANIIRLLFMGALFLATTACGSKETSANNSQLRRLIREYVDMDKAFVPQKEHFINENTYVNPKNFAWHEIRSKYAKPVYRWALFSVSRHLQNIRSKIKRSMIITSGYRNPRHNSAVGGASESSHMYGTAADVHTPDFDGNGRVNKKDKRILEYHANLEGADYVDTSYRTTHVHMDWRCESTVSLHKCR